MPVTYKPTKISNPLLEGYQAPAPIIYILRSIRFGRLSFGKFARLEKFRRPSFQIPELQSSPVKGPPPVRQAFVSLQPSNVVSWSWCESEELSL